MLRSTVFVVALTGLLGSSLVLAAACPPEGAGGDPVANRLRNRETVPTGYREIEVPEFLATHTPNLQTPARRDQFTAAHKSAVDPHEQEGVALTGYLVMAKRSGREPANCNDRGRQTIALWIGRIPEATKRQAKAGRSESVVVALTPYGQAQHKSWTFQELQKLAKQGAKVRVSGWAFYNPEHPEEIGKTRGTLWELHPVTRIEVWRNDKWVEL